MAKRYLEVHGKRFEISKATKLNLPPGRPGPAFYVDLLDDGTYRVIWDANFFDEMSDIDEIKIIRED